MLQLKKLLWFLLALYSFNYIVVANVGKEARAYMGYKCYTRFVFPTALMNTMHYRGNAKKKEEIKLEEQYRLLIRAP